MSQEMNARLGDFRQRLTQRQLDAFIVPRADEYLGEYVPEHNERLRWISGFTGSAGVAVILTDRAALFVDGRYTVQAAQQVDSLQFEMNHLIEQPYLDWICKTLKPGQSVGFDPRMFTYAWFEQAKVQLAAHQLTLIEEPHNPIDTLWRDRPRPDIQLGRLLPEATTGQSSQNKRHLLGHEITAQGAQAALITAADSIAWLLNIRGSDVPRLPVVLSQAIAYSDGRLDWFVDAKKVPDGITQHLGDGVRVAPETDFEAALKQLGTERAAVLADAQTSNAWCQLVCSRSGATLMNAPDPCLLPKATKNPVEIEGMRNAHLRDAKAMIRFLAWIDDAQNTQAPLDEALLADKLEALRREDPSLVDLSFDTISAAGPNAAMCHYNHQNGMPAQLVTNSLYLVDSGGQYNCGTTDITRTIAIGQPTQEMINNFTYVLKGTIALAQLYFPKGTTGSQIDSIARQFLWQQGLDYDHGTGHGVGHFLSVHEGPQRIGKGHNSTPLMPGMVLSDEPGYYKAGEYGIRCENLLVVKPVELTGADRPFYGFETLTWVPFDQKLVNKTLLTPQEKGWINTYHRQIRERFLTQFDDPIAQKWLFKATTAIS
jgi:Xaa-Pro aminopeptidase